jgi:two-component system sensor histidine kinase PilS (NtrC family)
LDVSDENARLMELIVKESARLNEILSDFLTYARSQRSSFNKVELCHLIGDMFEMARHHPSYHENIKLEFQSNEAFVYVFSDEDQLRQILINLIVNACQAIGEKAGKITASIDVSNPQAVKLKINDSGPGIPEDIANRIFDPFYSTKNDGTGLGLAIVQRLSKALDVELNVDSRDGGPTEFSLKFARIPHPQISIPAERTTATVS